MSSTADPAPDLEGLARWMAARVPGFEGPVALERFSGGQSNPTYALVSPSGRWVLRRKPTGPLLPSAHAVDREFRVISALSGAGFPVPRPVGYEEGPALVGAPFYVMDYVEGRIFWTLALPELARAARRPIYEAQIDTLADLHRIDPAEVGLGDYGKPGAYFARQVDRWSRQYRASETDPLPAMDRLIEWLPRTLPPEGEARIVHGDFRLDNMIFAADRPQVLAVLDWELSTLGDPMADLGYLLIAWVIPSSQRNGLAGLDLTAEGLPTAQEMVERYQARTGRRLTVSLDWLMAYNLFRLAAICQGIAGRIRDGTAASAEARATAAQAPLLAEAALSFAVKAGA
ncbi:phosphotransferase family protein [Brevundimonas sp. 2R-24]|uniref:Phosphotransferase family protein n=1 Tax=Peiella sedimenti TaxID=3061083 RepID=A0ABT8SP86_9CAUL|nr:phosphotransferase family protein [Caulobacteraceae bacterium XZ-24]